MASIETPRGCSPEPASQGNLGIPLVEYLELSDALVRRERIERAGRVSSDDPPALARLGVSAAQWEKLARLTSRRFTRELDLMAKRIAEARRRGQRRTSLRRRGLSSPVPRWRGVRGGSAFFAPPGSARMAVRAEVEIALRSSENAVADSRSPVDWSSAIHTEFVRANIHVLSRRTRPPRISRR